MLKKVGKIHFIGIGGIGMSGIAQICLRMGYKVSGSDLKSNQSTERLISLGAEVYEGHSSSNIQQADLVVYSSAIPEDNPELAIARNRNIKIIKRAEILAEMMKEKVSFVVAGAHGKTTTSSMLALLLKEAGYNPTVCVGGVVRNFSENCLLGDSEYFVAELDESDGSFLFYKPDYTILTNIDYEHVDYFKNWSNILKSYKKFINNIKTEGLLVCCADDNNIMHLLKSYENKYLLYGFSPNSHITAEKIKFDGTNSEFNCIYKSKKLGQIRLMIPGKHNILNSLAVIGMGLSLGINFNKIKDSLSRYKGTERRFHIRFNKNRFLVVDDYAHHPSEILATLEAARTLKPKRLVVIFQPHRYTRTQALFSEFCSCFGLADQVIITDIYPASEKPLEGVDAKNIFRKMLEAGKTNVYYLRKDDIINHILKILNKGDLCLFLGAGDIYKLANELSEILEERFCQKEIRQTIIQSVRQS